MALWYVDGAAGGGGTGTYASPWNGTEMVSEINSKANISNGDTILAQGTLTFTSDVSLTGDGGGADALITIEGYSGTTEGVSDGDQGRDANFDLDTTNFATIDLSGSGVQWTASGATFLRYRFLTVQNTGFTTNAHMMIVSTGCIVEQCSLACGGASSGTSAEVIKTGTDGVIFNCDIHSTNGGAMDAIAASGADTIIRGNRISSTNGSGILANASDTSICGNFIYGCGIAGIELSTDDVVDCSHNTIYNCVRGIDRTTASDAGASLFHGNLIKNCSTAEIDIGSASDDLWSYNRIAATAGSPTVTGTRNMVVGEDQTAQLDSAEFASTTTLALKDASSEAYQHVDLGMGAANAGAWQEGFGGGGGGDTFRPQFHQGSRQIGVQES